MSPEEFFLREAARPFVRDLEPRKYLAAAITQGKSVSRWRRKRRIIIQFADLLILAVPLVFEQRIECEIIIFCGSPGAGKSTLYRTYLKPLGYHRINQDTLKTVSSELSTFGPQLSFY